MEKLTNYIERSQSVITKEKNLEHLYTFNDFPVFMGCTDKPIETDIIADMRWEIDPHTGLIQLSRLIPMDILYMDQHMDATGLTWTMYNIALADYVVKNKIGDVLEIGGGSGKLAKLILEKDKLIKYSVVEPNPTFEATERLEIVKSFFSKDLKGKFPNIRTIILSQVLEHVYDPLEFLSDVSYCLPVGGRFVFGYPNLEFLFKNKFTNAINFEHTMLMTDYFIDYFLEKAGFKIISKTEYKNHSHFYTAEKLELAGRNNIELENRYSYYKSMFQDYIEYHKNLVNELNPQIKNWKGNVYLFGAHIFSQYLFSFGLHSSKFISILDNSPLKQGKRLYGTTLFVESPIVLSKVENPLIVLKAGLYNDEIKEDILTNINPSAKFI